MTIVDRRGSRQSSVLVGGTVLVGLVLLVAGVFGGFIPVPWLTTGPTRPPCTSLPAASEVQAALARHADVTRELQGAVPGARVTIGEPCDGEDADRGIVTISVPDAEASDAVSTWLGTHDGYGVPVEVTRR